MPVHIPAVAVGRAIRPARIQFARSLTLPPRHALATPRVQLRALTAIPHSSPSHFFTPLEPLLVNFFRPALPSMAATGLDDDLVTFLKTHASNDAFAESDPVKASQKLFPEAAYTDGEKAEVAQWVITASHVGSSVRKWLATTSMAGR